MRRRTLSGAAISAAAALILTACAATSASDKSDHAEESDTFKIGIASARSGWMAAFDIPAERAARLAVNRINDRGGVLGRDLEALVQDTQTDQQVAATAAEKLVESGADVLLVSSDFDYGSPSALVALENDKVAISIGAASPQFGTEGLGELAFTVGTPTPTVAAAGAEWALEQGWTTAVALCDQSIDYSVSLCSAFEETFAGQGGEIVLRENFQQDDSSISQQLAAMRQANADFIYLGSYLPGGASAVRQIRTSGIDLPIVSGAAMEGTEWLDSIPNLSDFYIPVVRYIHGPGDTKEVELFLEQYEEAYSETPELADAVVGYLAVELIAAALEANGGDTEGSNLAATLDSLKEVPTIIGETGFTSGRGFTVDREVAIVEVADGEMKFVEHFKPTNVPL